MLKEASVPGLNLAKPPGLPPPTSQCSGVNHMGKVDLGLELLPHPYPNLKILTLGPT